MADRTLKPDTNNDLILSNDDGSRKIAITNAGQIDVTGTMRIGGSQTLDGAGTFDVSNGTFSTSLAQKDAVVDGSTAINRSGNNLTFAGTVGNTGNNTISSGSLVISTAGQGITFGGDPDSRVNSPTVGDRTLYDYEEGTWTPVISDASGNTMDLNSSYNTGYYTKVGNLVTVSGYFITSSLGDPAASGNIRITGLPYTVVNNSAAHSGGGAAFGTDYSITAGQSISYYGAANTSYILLLVWDVTTGATAMQASEWTAGGQIIIGFSYRT